MVQATWCGNCKDAFPGFAAVAAEFPDVRFVKVDTTPDFGTALKKTLSVGAIPAVRFLPGGTLTLETEAKLAGKKQVRADAQKTWLLQSTNGSTHIRDVAAPMS